MKGCPDCGLEDSLTQLIYERVGTINKRKARAIAKEAARLARESQGNENDHQHYPHTRSTRDAGDE